MTDPNEELLSWAVENIKEWDDDFTHLRSDMSAAPLFYTDNGVWRVDEDKTWVGKNGVDYVVIEGSLGKTSPQVITKEGWESAVAVKDASKTSQEAQQGHIHAELMAEYALVAKTNPQPWREFQRLDVNNEWEDLLTPTAFYSERDYRRKPTPPKTMNIGGIIVEAWPLEKASEVNVSRYYMPAIDCGGGFTVQDAEWYSDRYDISALENNIVFSTKEQAQAVADALNLVYNRAIGKVEE